MVCALLAACGTRLPDEAFVEAGVAAGGGGLAAGPGGANATTGSTLPGGAPAPTIAGGSGGPGATLPGGAPAPGSGPAAGGPNQASDVGITETTIRIGTIVAENGILGDAFAPAVRGLRAWVEWINAQGGINGRTVELFTCDDREDRSRALQCAQRLVERDQVFALVATNTRALGGAATYLAESGIPVLGIPITNAFNRFQNFYSVYGSGYPRDGSAVGDDNTLNSQTGVYRWFRENMGVTEAAVFYYDIPESSQAGEFIQKGLELEGFNVTPYVVSFAAPSFDQAVADMERRGVEIIMDGMDDGANRALCDAMSRRGFSVRAKVSTIVVYGASVGTTFNETCRNSMYVPGDSAPYTDTSVPIIAEFNTAMARYQPGEELHQWALEAWFMASIVQDGVAAMGAAPTRAGFVQFINGLENYTGNGIMDEVDYQVEDHTAPTREHCFVIVRWQDTAPGGWIRATPSFPYCIADAKQYQTGIAEDGT